MIETRQNLIKKILAGTGWFLILSLVFGLSYTQLPLFSDNQNSHLLRGLALSGYGNLQNDWLVRTPDPFPVFSSITGSAFRLFGKEIFYILQLLIFGVYIYCFIGIALEVVKIRKSRSNYFLFAAAAIFLHSVLASQLFQILTGQDIARQMHYGVALQYVINNTFQPSSFSVLMLLSIYLFLRNRPYLASLAIALCVNIYFSIALAAAIMVACFMYILAFRDRDYKKALLAGILALILVLPTVIYVYDTFKPSDPSKYAQMQHIFFDVRFPHHANPVDWGKDSFGKLALVILAAILIRRTRIFPIMTISTTAIVVLTLVVLIFENKWLGLLFPWRLSVIIVPIASAIVLVSIFKWLYERFDSFFSSHQKTLNIISVMIIFSSVAYGIYFSMLKHEEFNSSPGVGVMRYVSEHKSAGDLYLVPLDMQRFRLETGAPIFVDYKSHPYHDSGVVEWYDRLQTVRSVYDSAEYLSGRNLVDLAKRYKITHIILPSPNIPLESIPINQLYQDSCYALIKF